jgi:predicted DNA-binding transcriptional regulator AlpA
MNNPAESFGLPEELSRSRVVNEATAARICGVSHQTMERMRKSGTAPRHVQLSTRRLGYRICDLTAWLDARAGA